MEYAETRPEYVIVINHEHVSCTQSVGAYCRQNAHFVVI